MASAESLALALVTKSDPGGSLLKKLPARLTAELALIQKLEAQTTGRAIRVGLWLWQAKARVPHGQFKAWIESAVTGRGYRQCAFYMKIALVFAEKSRVGEKGLAALLQHDFKRAPKNAEAKDALAKLAAFIGDLSLNELLIKHGIKGVGLKAELTEGEAPPAATAGEQLELVWEQAYQPAKSLADLLVERAAILTPDKREALAAELTRALQALRAV